MAKDVLELFHENELFTCFEFDAAEAYAPYELESLPHLTATGFVTSEARHDLATCMVWAEIRSLLADGLKCPVPPGQVGELCSLCISLICISAERARMNVIQKDWNIIRLHAGKEGFTLNCG